VKLAGGLGARYSYASRFENAPGTNPEELIGAALASCFAMALTARLTKAGFQVDHVKASARVHLDAQNGEHRITRIALSTTGEVRNIDDKTFREHADQAIAGCPVSRALQGTELVLDSAELARMTTRSTKPPPGPDESNV
jgi:osmotically inducible protein OsmC